MATVITDRPDGGGKAGGFQWRTKCWRASSCADPSLVVSASNGTDSGTPRRKFGLRRRGRHAADFGTSGACWLGESPDGACRGRGACPLLPSGTLPFLLL